MSKKTYKERAREQREKEILQVTRQIMTEKGYPALNMDDVAEGVGISKPTLYQHFSTKEALIVSVIAMQYEEFEADLIQHPELPALQELERVLRNMLERRFSGKSIHPHLHPELIAMIHDNETLTAYRERVMKSFYALIDRAKEEGNVTSDVPTPLIARMMFCLQGVLLDPTNSHKKIEKENLEMAISQAITLLMNGIRSS